MNRFKTLLLLCLMGQAASTLSCETIYLNAKGRASVIEENVREALKEEFKYSFGEENLRSSNLMVYPHLENNFEVKPNSLILDLNSESDMTGSDIVVTLYRTDDAGHISFQGSHREFTNGFTKGKFKTLKDLSTVAINLSCRVY